MMGWIHAVRHPRRRDLATHSAGHEVFNRAGSGLGPAVARQIAAPGNTGQIEFHATMVGHVLAGTGYFPATGTSSALLLYGAMGMAPAATIWSGAIATEYATSLIQNPSPTDRYFVNQDGTSFSSPVVAGGVALMKDAAKYFSSMPATALDSRVVKAVLMATADKTVGWNNGQTTVDGVVRTTQALDYRTGAGAVDLTAAGLTYVDAATRDVSGTGGGTITASGWDFGAVSAGNANDYAFGTSLTGTTELQVSLAWFTGGAFDAAGYTGARTSFANLDLQVWRLTSGSFTTLVAESASLYNNAEMLRLTLPAGDYGLRVALPAMIYDIGTTPVTAESYGLSWTTVAVPEPSAVVLAATGLALCGVAIRLRRSARAARDATVMDGSGG
jgi:hypothetical protein